MKKFFLSSVTPVAFLMATLMIFSNLSYGQDEKEGFDKDELTIGSKAPALDIEHWVSDGGGKLEKIKDFKDGKVYVVEFWATWCGPCIASMPHLSELQEKHAKNGLQIISVSDEKIETVEKFLARKVGRDDSGQTYGDLTGNYCLTTDPDRSTAKDYMAASGQSGIPCAFIVGKKGMIEWIGHPMEIDKPLEEIFANKWDRKAFAVEYKESKDFDFTMQRVVQMYRSKKVEEAVALLEKTIAKVSSKRIKTQASVMRMQMLVTTGNKKAPQAVADFAKEAEDGEMLNEVAWNIYLMSQQIELDPRIIKGAIQCAEKAVKVAPKESHIWDTLAHLVADKGEFEKAIEYQTKAVELDKTKDPEIREYLEELKAAQKKEAEKGTDEKEEKGKKKKDDKFDF